MDGIIELRRELHRHPELSGGEAETARRLIAFFTDLRPDDTVTGLGGNGVAFVFSGKRRGPTVLLRCEMDAVPVEETNTTPFRSVRAGVSHQCGHDGHMAILAAVGEDLSSCRPSRGRVVLLFQPAEETGTGASAVLRDRGFADIEPDIAFALHNLPGFPLGRIVVGAGVFSSASRGMVVALSGASAHSAQPETGRSPARAMCRIIERLSNVPADRAYRDGAAFVTIVGSRLGEKAFGTSPGRAEIYATLRGRSDDTMERLVSDAERIVRESASAEGLEYDIAYEDIFPATVNAERAVDIVRRAAVNASLHVPKRPFPWSEDFGRLASRCEGALFGIGAGSDTAGLHTAGYVFPEELIPLGRDIFRRILDQCLEHGAI